MLFFIINYAYVYVCVNVCWVGVRYMCECSYQQNTENWILWGCVTGGCELPYMSSGNWKWILCKSSTCFWLMSHSWPILGDFNYRSNNYLKKDEWLFFKFLIYFCKVFWNYKYKCRNYVNCLKQYLLLQKLIVISPFLR